MKNITIVKFIKTIVFLQAMRKRIRNSMTIAENNEEKFDKLYDLDDKIWDKMTVLRKQFRLKYYNSKEIRRQYNKQYELACRLLKVDSYDIFHY
jgi:hypothetical protein